MMIYEIEIEKIYGDVMSSKKIQKVCHGKMGYKCIKILCKKDIAKFVKSNGVQREMPQKTKSQK